MIIPSNRQIPDLTRFTDSTYYFEITLLKVNQSSKVSIGLVGKFHDMKGKLGTTGNSYGFQLDENCIYQSKDEGLSRPYGGDAKCCVKDITIGCGWDQRNEILFFTVNNYNYGTAFTKVKGTFHAAVGVQSPDTEVLINFGVSKFHYDVGRFWKNFHEAELGIQDSIRNRLCTFNVSRRGYFPQLMFHCNTCNLNGNMGMCSVCAIVCHGDHDITEPTFSPSFFCDCGDLTASGDKNICKCLKILEN
eukprot:TRINITY_DN5938_c0_g1_i1.p2 TRINITY_DN5938_c0_g1~~TRINITY_DN5938_c0_g1_i1.p2  ORF type:complete len:247 (-),score=33.12 TRINITY_DN5938_c0_g1_i1:29-769(-)